MCRVVTVDVDREREAARRHRVRGTPTFVFFKAGREVHRFRGGALPPMPRSDGSGVSE